MDCVWKELHSSYQKQDWVARPSIFAMTAMPYFPRKGKILELGAGYGQDGMFFAENGYNVLMTDIETESLALNLSKQEKALQEKLDVLQLDLKKPFPFMDQAFDVVYAHLSLHYFDERTTRNIISEIKRVLKPKGILAFLANSVNDPEYQTTDSLEDDFFLIDKITKRYFSIESARRFTQSFDVCLLDDQGQTYKDMEKGISNLIRFIGSPSENESVKKIAEDYAERVWNKKDLRVIDELLDPECVIHSLLGDFYGPNAMKNVVQSWLKGFPDLVVQNCAIVAENDLAIIHWQAQGSHQGEFKGIPPTGKKISYAGVTIYRIVQSKIVEYWAYLDMQHLLKQI